MKFTEDLGIKSGKIMEVSLLLNTYIELLPKDDIMATLNNINVEEIRKEVIAHYDITIDADKEVEEVLKNVYYTHLPEEGFDEQATEVYRHHEDILKKILSLDLASSSDLKASKLEIHPLTGEKRDYFDKEWIKKIDSVPEDDNE